MWERGVKTLAIAARLSAIGPHRSKNSVVGKAHSLQLPPRPSPIREPNPHATAVKLAAQERRNIKRRAERAARAPAEKRGPAKIDAAPRVAVGGPGEGLAAPGAAPSRPMDTHEPAALPAPILPPVVVRHEDGPAFSGLPEPAGRPGRECQWPIGEPRRPGFRFCCAARWSGTRWPYCETHARLARRPAREDAA